MSNARNIITSDISAISFTPFLKNKNVGGAEQPPPFLKIILSFILVFGKILAGGVFSCREF